MLAKPSTMVVPLIVWILDGMVLGRSRRESIRWLWPWLFLAAAGGVETFIFQGVHVDANNIAVYLRPLVALQSLAFYLGKILWPMHLTIDYGLSPAVLVHDPWLAVKCLLVVSLGVFLWWMGRAARLPVAEALIFLAPLLPVLGLVTFDFQSYSNVADHYLYLSMFGMALTAAWACRRYSRWPVFAGAAIVLILLGVASNRQARYWKDSTTLFSHVLAVNPDSSTAYTVLSRFAVIQKNYPMAVGYAEHAVRLSPNDPNAHVVLGAAWWHEGRKAMAMEEYAEGLRLDPNNVDGLQGFADGLFLQGRFDEAEDLIRRQLSKAPRSAEGYFDLGSILYHKQQLPEAIDELRHAVSLDPGRPQFRVLLGKALGASGDDRAAEAQFETARQLETESHSDQTGAGWAETSR
jgi:protein O-mannosyl-transferase